MEKQPQDHNTAYISPRLQQTLCAVSQCALTAVVAPMGYGKTTAVNWYLSEQARLHPVQIIRISVYSDNLAIFWKSAQTAFTHAGLSFLEDYPCPVDSSGGSLLTDDLCHTLAGVTPCYLFIDDFHLLTDRRVAAFLCRLADRLPENAHIIVASRDSFLPAEALIRLGRRVCRIGVEQLQLHPQELRVYAQRCGANLTDAQMDALLYASEGWFSAVYLSLLTFLACGSLPGRGSDIYAMFTAAMIDPLPSRQREFLAVMGLADEFTVEMARFVSACPDARELLADLTAHNAFITRLPDGVTFRFHHMMKQCAEGVFQALDPEKQTAYRSRFGMWYERQGQLLHAMDAYRRCGDYDALLRVVQRDAGILLCSLDPSDVLSAVDACPLSVLKAHPPAILVLMRSMFNWHRIPDMLRLQKLLLASLAEHPEILPEERGNLLGECDLVMSFLMYNDIQTMSRLHRSASRQMSRPAISIHNSGGWTFGSPSVLMMFHREPGKLSGELADMHACMPHYYKVTDGHGQGAEQIMQAEAYFLQGHFLDAQITLERAYGQMEGNGQINMALCCDFLSLRLSMWTDMQPRYTPEQRRAQLLHRHNAAWLHIWDASCAYYFALLGAEAEIPELYRAHQLSSIHLLAPGRPMAAMIENQVYLAQGAYAKVIGRSEELLAMCQGLHYALVALHLRIQAAAACRMLGRLSQARELLEQALADAAQDGLVLPFAENYFYLKDLLEADASTAYLRQIVRLGRRLPVQRPLSPPSLPSVLTEREREIAALLLQRLSNREIAQQLFLSEGSVKQYLHSIYAKLHITGDTRTKRQQLAALLRSKS